MPVRRSRCRCRTSTYGCLLQRRRGIRSSRSPTPPARGRCGIAHLREHEIDRGAGGVEGAVEVTPPVLDTHGGLIDMLGRLIWRARTARLRLQFGTVALDPAPEGRVVRLQAARAEPRGGLAERKCGLQISAHGAQNQLRIAVSTLEDRRPACQCHDCQQPAAIRHRCNTAKARTFNTFSSLPGLAVSRKYFGVGEDTERGRQPARRAAAPQPPAGGRSRSACVANGRLGHEGEGAFRRALPCVLYRV